MNTQKHEHILKKKMFFTVESGFIFKLVLNNYLVIFMFMGYMENTYGQACPACSNPALQSSEKLEAGADTLQKGACRATINVTSGFDYQGGHEHNHGLSPEGQEIVVPLHEHIVELDFVRMELNFEYTFKNNWSIWFRVPYDVKIQTASINFIEPVNDYEKEAILRNRDIHHRSETNTGLSDFRLFAAHRFIGLLGKKSRLDVALGSSLPVGKTEENPLKAGDGGEKHLHIQFGSGTFDPLVELHYVTALSGRFSLAVYSMNKLPFYENSKTYLAPLETTSGIALGYKVRDWLTLRGTLANFIQSQAKWDNENDPNSGLISFNANFTATFKLNNGLTITPGYRFPVYQQTLSDEGDAFEYGPTFMLNLSYIVSVRKQFNTLKIN